MTRPGRARAGLLSVLAAVLAGGCGGSTDTEPNAAGPVEVRIGDRTWQAEVAADPDSRWQGLSGRESMSSDEAMLFIFPEPAVKSFCMRGCSFDIDIAFINADREVVTIHRMKEEPLQLGEVGYSSEVPVKYALEVLGGELGKAGASVGDRVEFGRTLPEAR